MKLTTLAFVSSIALAGCYGETDVAYTTPSPAPDMVYVSPGVEVIADYDYPVFFNDGFYWRYDSGVWYSSRSYRGGWAVSRNVPVAVRGIDRPSAYVHYRGNVAVRGNVNVRSNANVRGNVVVRDHRAPARPAPRAVVRDHRR